MEVEIIEHDELEVDMGDGSFVLDNDYKNIKNKPSINDVVLDGNKTLKELGIQATEEGKGLSTNDFTNTYKEKLDGLENYNDTEIKNSIDNLDKNKVDKVEGKWLSTEDFTTELKTKLEGLSNYDDTEIKDDLKNKVDKEEGKGLSTNDFDDTYKKKLDGLSNYDDTKIKQEISSLADSLAETDKSLADKVDKEEGKGLSTNDFTTALKTKLEGLSNYDDTKIKEDISKKVDKEEGKGLSTNDFDNAYKEKLDGLSNYNDEAITDALTKANAKIAELEATVTLQDEQIPRRRRRRREHNANR